MSPKSTKPKRSMPEWQITVIRQKGETLGIVEAANAAAAIKVAIERWGITDVERRRRLVATRIGALSEAS